MNKGELNTESVWLLKGHLSPDFRSEERTVCGAGPSLSGYEAENGEALSPLFPGQKADLWEFVFKETLQAGAGREERGSWEFEMTFFCLKNGANYADFSKVSPEFYRGLVTYSWEG